MPHPSPSLKPPALLPKPQETNPCHYHYLSDDPALGCSAAPTYLSGKAVTQNSIMLGARAACSLRPGVACAQTILSQGAADNSTCKLKTTPCMSDSFMSSSPLPGIQCNKRGYAAGSPLKAATNHRANSRQPHLPVSITRAVKTCQNSTILC